MFLEFLCMIFEPKCSNTPKMSRYSAIVYYRRTLLQNASIPPYCILPIHTFTTLQ